MKLKDLPLIGSMFEEKATTKTGMTVSEGDPVVARIYTQGDDHPDLMVPATVKKLDKDGYGGTVEDAVGTTFPLSLNDMHPPETEIDSDVIPPYYPANNFHFAHSNEILDPAVLNAG